jgi:hypothetical protein
MPAPIRITEADLRQAMREPRYWRSGHPERTAFTGWVTEGFRGRYPCDAAPRQSVWVEAYTREGHPVAAHWRGIPSASDRSSGRQTTPGQDSAGDAPVLVQANALRKLWELWRRSPPDGCGSGGPRSGGRPGNEPTPQRRSWLGADGRDRLNDIRSDPATQRLPNAHSAGVPQYSRPGGISGRQRDLERLNPVGQPVQRGPDTTQHTLADGRIATMRRATHARSGGEPTLEIAEPLGNGRFGPSDIFRYPPSR